MATTFRAGKTRFETRNGVFVEGEQIGVEGKVFILQTREDPSSLDQLVRLKNDFEFTSKIDLDFVLKGLKLVRTGQGIVLLKEYFDGMTLHRYINAMEISIPIFLKIAANVTRVIKILHEKGIILKDCSPHNFLIAPETFKIVVCSLGSATNLSQEQSELRKTELVMENLQYIAPEETGRVGRSVDHRSDLYSLGVMFYEILCGRLPFNFKDPVEMVHAHIAKEPIAPRKLNNEIPQALSDLVMKLLAKNPEDRYQSAGGLLYDLEQAEATRNKRGEVSGFELGAKDYSRTFRISEKLYGRQEEIKELVDALSRIPKSGAELILVAGYSGIGKTRLIHEVQKPIVERNGFFVMGKFDQYNRDTPFLAFSQAFHSLIQQLLSDPKEEIKYWTSEIQKALGDDGKVLIELVPSLENLIGPQPSVPKLGPNESKDRLQRLVLNFAEVVTRRNRPLIVFIDDLQWATDSLGLLSHLIHSGLPNLLLIGAYRDNEVNVSHPLMMAIEQLKKELPDKVRTITLQRLAVEEVNQMVADSVRSSPGETKELGSIVYAKTKGNPFFIKQFISRLVEDKLIYFDEENLTWVWNLQGISDLNITENVVDLVIRKMKKLSPDVQEVISLAACFGNRFDLSALSIISERSESECGRIIWDAVREELVNPLGAWVPHYKDELWKEIGFTEQIDEYHNFKFQHDRIQQAAYALIPQQELKKTHLRIGQLLLTQLKADHQDEYLFEILNHLNVSSDLINDKDELQRIAALNYRAGMKAMGSNAIRPAVSHFAAGMKILEENQSSDLFKDLLIARSECEYLLGNYDESEKLFNTALDKAQGNLAKADILSRKMALYENTQRHMQAIEAAKDGLAYLGMNLPINPGNLGVMKELLTVKWLLRNKKTDDLLHHKNMESPELLLTMQILMNLWGPVYLLQKQDLLAYKILKMVNLSIRHGNSKESALAYAFYGYVLSAQLKDYKQGFDFSRLGNQLNEKFDDTSLRSKTYVIADGCVAHWKIPYRSVLKNLQVAFETGIKHNDIIYAGYATTFLNRAHFIMGENLETVYQKCARYIHFNRQIQSSISLHQMLPWARLQLHLLNREPETQEFQDMIDQNAEESFIENWAKEKVTLPKANYYIAGAIDNYFFNNFIKAYECIQKAGTALDGVPGLPESAEHYIYEALSILAMAHDGDQLTSAMKKALKKNVKMLATWSKNAPANFESRYLLVQAEMAALKGKTEKAVALYEQSVDSGLKSEQLYMPALANERLACFYLRQEDISKAHTSLRNAHRAYLDWGAFAKVGELEKQYPEAFATVSKQTAGDPVVRDYDTIQKITSTSIDLQSILKAAESISKEVVLEQLMGQLLRIIIENAGAQSGHFIMPRSGSLFIAARSSVTDEFIPQFTEEALEDARDVSQAIVRYVFNSKEPVLVDDAVNDQRYASDTYIQENKCRSILCWPLLEHGRCVAVFYLENNLSPNAFTPERVEILKLLSGHMAISIENALLYENLEQKVKERTATIEEQRIAIEIAKKQSDDLLLNILPHDVADQLKNQGFYSPRHYDSVSIMFTDFEKFTDLATKLSAEDLVHMIDECYKAFDAICEKNGVEKIKTIGDSYMCVAGLTEDGKNHALSAVQTGLEMLGFINTFNTKRKAAGLPSCPMRVGIHTGPVIAGVVGHHKFAFDIWGDSVNTAFRMESHGQPGKLNISHSTYEIVKDQLNCTPRGEVEVKNKGKIRMYFVED